MTGTKPIYSLHYEVNEPSPQPTSLLTKTKMKILFGRAYASIHYTIISSSDAVNFI